MTQYRFISGKPQPTGIIGQIVAAIVGVVVLGASLVLGAFFLAAIFGFLLIVGAVMWLRIWWWRRKMPSRSANDSTLEGEYTVVENQTSKHDSTRRD